MIYLADKYHCSGCSACANICGQSAIEMRADEEGFLQPHIDKDKCVECGLCMKRCPVLNPLEVKLNKQEAYALISKNDRKVSSSGGAFSVFAKFILAQGGIVFGAAIDKDFQVSHISVEKIEDLALLRGSKYVQSKIGDIFKQVRNELRAGRKVLFTGTGCQVAGLYSFLGKRYEDYLITLDLVCHGVPSQAAFDAYLKKIDHPSGGNIEEFRFRKFDSWDYRPAVKLSESKWKILELADNSYMNAFFEGYTFRESCFNCQYCNTKRVGTFTIADYWGIGRHGVPFKKNVAAGVSLVIDNQGLMPSLISELENEAYIEKRNMPEAIAEQTNLNHPLERSPKRDHAVKDMIDSNISLVEYARKNGLPYKYTAKTIIVKVVKDLIYFFGLYNVYKTLIYKLGK